MRYPILKIVPELIGKKIIYNEGGDYIIVTRISDDVLYYKFKSSSYAFEYPLLHTHILSQSYYTEEAVDYGIPNSPYRHIELKIKQMDAKRKALGYKW